MPFDEIGGEYEFAVHVNVDGAVKTARFFRVTEAIGWAECSRRLGCEATIEVEYERLGDQQETER